MGGEIGFRKLTPVQAPATIPARGITSAVIDKGKPSYVKVEVSPDPDDDFSAPTYTEYRVLYYGPEGFVEASIPQSTPPSP